MKRQKSVLFGVGLTISLGGLVAPAARAQDTVTFSPIRVEPTEQNGDVGFVSNEARLLLQDAPVRQTLEMLLEGAQTDFTIDPSVKGYITAKVAKLPVGDQIKAVSRFASQPFLFEVKENVHIVRAATAGSSSKVRTREPKFAKTANNSVPASVYDVVRRVAGIRYVRDEYFENDKVVGRGVQSGRHSAAILITGNDGPNVYGQVVVVGMRVQDGLPSRSGVLTVKAITDKGITLLTADEKEIDVPLAGIADSVEKTDSKETK